MATLGATTLPQEHRPALWVRLVGARSVQGGRRAIWGYLFIMPWITGLLVFVAGPILASLYFSLTNYDILRPPRWVGFENYSRALCGTFGSEGPAVVLEALLGGAKAAVCGGVTGDPLFWPSLGRSIYFAVGVVPLSLAGSLGLAMLLNQGFKGTNLFRTAYFLPHLTPAVALSVVWLWLLHVKLGPINAFLRAVGIGEFAWFSDSETVIPSFILISLWTGMGGSAMLIFLAGLQGVPRELEEAALVDGANIWQRFRHVTLPMITPTIFFNLVLGIISALQVFTVAFVATAGGPAYGSWFYALHLYKQAFDYQRLGYAAALAWIFLVLVLLITLLNVASSRKWVFYRGGS